MNRNSLLAVLILILTGCGGGSSSSGPVSSVQISGLMVAATANSQGTTINSGSLRNSGGNGNGAWYVPLTNRNTGLTGLTNGAVIDFVAPAGNIATFSLAIYDANGLLVFSQQGPIANITNMTTGQIEIFFPTTTSLAAGSYSCQITISDTSGYMSNTLSGNFNAS